MKASRRRVQTASAAICLPIYSLVGYWVFFPPAEYSDLVFVADQFIVPMYLLFVTAIHCFVGALWFKKVVHLAWIMALPAYLYTACSRRYYYGDGLIEEILFRLGILIVYTYSALLAHIVISYRQKKTANQFITRIRDVAVLGVAAVSVYFLGVDYAWNVVVASLHPVWGSKVWFLGLNAIAGVALIFVASLSGQFTLRTRGQPTYSEIET